MTDDEFKANLLVSWQSTDFNLDIHLENQENSGEVIRMIMTGSNGFKEILRLSMDLERLTIEKKDGKMQHFERDLTFSWVDPSDVKWHRLSFEFLHSHGQRPNLKLTMENIDLQMIVPQIVFSQSEWKA